MKTMGHPSLESDVLHNDFGAQSHSAAEPFEEGNAKPGARMQY